MWVALKRAGSCMVAFGGSVSRNFLNSLLTSRFVKLVSGNSSVNLFAVYPFKYKLFIKILYSSLNTMLIVDKQKTTTV